MPLLILSICQAFNKFVGQTNCFSGWGKERGVRAIDTSHDPAKVQCSRWYVNIFHISLFVFLHLLLLSPPSLPPSLPPALPPSLPPSFLPSFCSFILSFFLSFFLSLFIAGKDYLHFLVSSCDRSGYFRYICAIVI